MECCSLNSFNINGFSFCYCRVPSRCCIFKNASYLFYIDIQKVFLSCLRAFNLLNIQSLWNPLVTIFLVLECHFISDRIIIPSNLISSTCWISCPSITNSGMKSRVWQVLNVLLLDLLFWYVGWVVGWVGWWLD